MERSEIRENAASGSAGPGLRVAPTGLRASPRHMRRYREPAAVLPRPAIGVAPNSLLALGRGVAGRGVDDGEIAQHANLDVLRGEIPDLHRDRRLLEERGAVNHALVGIGAIEIPT